jgi:hypothetical protein
MFCMSIKVKMNILKQLVEDSWNITSVKLEGLSFSGMQNVSRKNKIDHYTCVTLNYSNYIMEAHIIPYKFCIFTLYFCWSLNSFLFVLLLKVYVLRLIQHMSEWVSEWLLFNVNSAIFQLYHGENKSIFNEMMMRSALY